MGGGGGVSHTEMSGCSSKFLRKTLRVASMDVDLANFYLLKVTTYKTGDRETIWKNNNSNNKIIIIIII